MIPIHELYDARLPLPSNALDIFEGEWTSIIPTFGYGTANLFDDHRIKFFEENVGGFAGKRILELGPLEAGHTFMLSSRGAADILAIEANRKCYLKCLIIKELLNIRARFLLGDFMKYFETSPAKFDLILASGVLYHMMEPLRLIRHLTNAADKLCVWTHYYDAGVIRGRPDWNQRFSSEPNIVNFAGVDVTMHEQRYLNALDWGGFCGGAAATSNWLTRESLFAVFEARRFDVVIGDESRDHPAGPCVTFVAKRRP